MEYLHTVFTTPNKSMFQSWDHAGIICGVKTIVETCDHTCICIAVNNNSNNANTENGTKRNVKVIKNPNPAHVIDSLNSGKHGSRRANRTNERWMILAYLLVDTREISLETIDNIIRTCKSKRQLCDRVIVLINMAIQHRQRVRIDMDTITVDNEWYMRSIGQRLSEIPQFMEWIVMQ
jgi:hypothetical protein